MLLKVKEELLVHFHLLNIGIEENPQEIYKALLKGYSIYNLSTVKGNDLTK